MRNSLAIGFLLRKPKNKENTNALVYVRITVNGRRCELALSRKWDPASWDSKKGKATGTKESARSLNNYLESVRIRICEVQRRSLEEQNFITLDIIKNGFLGREQNQRTLITVFEEHNEKVKSLIGKQYAKSTFNRYKICLTHVKNFMKSSYSLEDIPVNRIDYNFLTDFEYYLRSVRKCMNNSAIKYIWVY